MENAAHRAMAVVGVGAILPDAPNASTFWNNIKQGRYSISDVARERWDPALYFDPDPAAPDKTYSKIGGWVRDFAWDPMQWRLPVPPRVAEAMDVAQKWAISCTRQALEDYGYPKRSLDLERTAVILGNAMAGEKQFFTVLRAYFPEFAEELSASEGFAALPEKLRREITSDLHARIGRRYPEITEDTMPGELSNCIAGRIANLYNFRGPNFTCDAACASAMAAISAAVEGLAAHEFDVAITGGIDRNMGASSFIKFCKIGALSGSGSRPYADGADGFVMGEGAAFFILKRLADAERNGDRIYAVLRGMGGSSDGKGKGITAPNPVGQKLAVERAWANAGVSPATATLIEGHGTSTRVGDVVETQSMAEVLQPFHLPPGSIALGSVKSNIGHLKSAAGAAGILKAVMALHERVLPPSINCDRENPDIDFARSPLRVNRELRPWDVPKDQPRRAGASAFGFGGTNFHAVLEDYVPGRIIGNGKRSVAVNLPEATDQWNSLQAEPCGKRPLRGALVLGAGSEKELAERLEQVVKNAEAGRAPATDVPAKSDLLASERIAIDFADAADLAQKSAKALKALTANHAGMWKALRAKGVFRGSGPAPKIAFLYTGQGSQYVNMLKTFRESEPVVAGTFAEADRALKSLLGKPLSEFIFVDHGDKAAIAKAEEDLRQTAITQPAVLATDIALTRMLALYGIQPDMTMGHSLGEYGALVAAGVLPFDEALEAVSARGREMTRVSVGDHGRMAAVNAPLDTIERLLKMVDGYVVIANLNSTRQAVIGGASDAVGKALDIFHQEGIAAVELHVSHAFHTSIVAPASDPLRRMLQRHNVRPPQLPVIANVTGDFYPTGADAVPQIVDILARQVAAPVQFVKGLRTLYAAGARLFVEMGPKKALQGFVDDVFEDDPSVVSLFTNHPKLGDVASFNQALCGFYAAGLGSSEEKADREVATVETRDRSAQPEPVASAPGNGNNHREAALGRLFAEFIDRASEVMHGGKGRQDLEPVGITGAALGLPGTAKIFDDENVARILRGEQFIHAIPERFRQAMLDKNVTRLVKSDQAGPTFESIHDLNDVIKLAGRGREFDLENEFGVAAERLPALDRVTRLAMAAGIDALHDAGIPLVMRYKTTSKGTQLPDRWALPESMRDDTGIIFASAFPGYNALLEDVSHYFEDRSRRQQLAQLEAVRTRLNGNDAAREEVQRRISDLKNEIARHPYVFDRRFLFKVLAMGHSQFAEFIGARGPNTQVNTACASTTQAMVLAEDWIRSGRCSRVVIISADDVTSDNMMEWIGAGFLATGAAATDEKVEDAAIPFDKRRHGMLIGMGAAAFVIESADSWRERGIQPICEVLSAVTANSAFHGTRLDVQHIGDMMERLIRQAEEQCGIRRDEIAPQTVFVSHETYTPARGGSASAEVHALRRVFGERAAQIVIANTKGFTGHPMGTGIEDAVAVKMLETGVVPPVANFKEVDPELGPLNLSKGGAYPVQYALRLAAGFGSQISMTLLRWVSTVNGVRPTPNSLGYSRRVVDTRQWNQWLEQIAGHSAAELEVVQRTLRVRDMGPGSRTAVAAKQVHAAPQPVTTPAPAAPASVPAVARTSSHTDEVKDRILAIVAGKTGYPQDMLDLDLDLEADLGVDTVKQAEVFAAVREAYSIPRDEKLKLRDFPTLAHVIRFVHERRPDIASASPVTPPITAPATVATEPSGDPVKDRILDLAVEKTGYPRDMLDLDLDLEADLGVDTVKQAEMFAAVREIYSIPRDETRKLRDYPTLAAVIRYVHEKRPDLASVPAESAPAAPALATPAATQAIPATGSIAETVLDIVARQTGYPKEMLDLDLDLEADLGIDTVKQAEMFAAVRAAYNIPRDQNLKLRDFPTLAHVIRFAQERQAGTQTTTAPIVQESKPSHPHARVEERPMAESFEAAEKVPRRVPVAVLRPGLSICKPTGIALAGKRVLVVPDKGGVAKPLSKKLKALGAEVLRLEADLPTELFVEKLKALAADEPVHGVYWLPALDPEAAIENMDLTGWREALRVRVKLLFHGMRTLYEQIAPPDTFLISATRMGGQHGYDPAGAVAPLGGPVCGFTKTYKRERPDATVKVIDFERDRKSSEIAETLIEETLRDPGAVEIGYQRGQRWTVSLEELPVKDGHAGLTLDSESVFVVTGAAGSIVSAIVTDLAAASGGTFYLLDLVPEPDPANPDLKQFVSDKEGLKRELFSRIQQRGERATPALVEREIAGLERAHAALTAIEAVRAAGGTAHYFSVNLTDFESVSRAIDQVRQRSGRIDVLLHAAGLERSHFLPDKDPREFDLVFDVKADGWFNLLRSIGDMPVAATVAFSSIAGRFGNAGQTDYSSANDLLCKFASSFRTTRLATRGIAIDWTAWGGIGMATRGSIPKMMEVAGIDMLPPDAGIPWIRRELTEGGTRGEVVVGQRLGVLLNEWDPEGGVDLAAGVAAVSQCGPMVDGIAGMTVQQGLSCKALLDPAAQAFLHDHQIEGTPVLPGVMGIEAFAEATSCILPGWHVADVEDIDFLAPFKFYRGEPRSVTTNALFRREGDALVADCRLTGVRHLANQAEPQVTTHFTARVRLVQEAPTVSAIAPAPAPGDATVDAASIYRVYFHGPAYQVLKRAWRSGQRIVGEFALDLPPNHVPAERSLLMAPRLIEFCFQTAGLWEIATDGRMGLPQHVERVSVYGAPEANVPLYAIVTPHAGTFDAEVVDGLGKVYVVLKGYRTVTLPERIDPQIFKALQPEEECETIPV